MKRKRELLILPLMVLAILIVAGVTFFMLLEGWTLTDAFYFVVMTITTVGFGDFVPSHDLSKVVTALYSLVSVPLVLFIFGLLAQNYFDTRILALEKRLQSILAKEEMLEDRVEEDIRLDKAEIKEQTGEIHIS